MTNSAIATGNDTSPFDSIRRTDEQGEYWLADELMYLLGTQFQSPNKKLYADHAGMLILESAASVALERYYGVTADAQYLWNQAIRIYRGQPAAFVFHSVMEVIHNAQIWETSEVGSYPFIKKYWDVIKPISGYLESTNHETDKKHIPDFFAINDNRKIPVEVKCRNFNKDHLHQLKSYIKTYQSSIGIAIAPNLCSKIVIPKNVLFVKFDKQVIQEKEGYKPISQILCEKVTEFV